MAVQISIFLLILAVTGEVVVSDDSWPEGGLSLLMPQSGCPGSDFKTGTVKLNTESSNGLNEDRLSSGNHFPSDVKQRDGNNNFIVLTFCTSTKQSTPKEWPKGCYCFNPNGMRPNGFDIGTIFITTETDDNADEKTGSAPYGNGRLSFYCRCDGSADTPIELPTSMPFYLYKYGDKCQQVQGMEVVEEFIILDTEDTKNNDHLWISHIEEEVNATRPEMLNNMEFNSTPIKEFNPIKFPLCYYSKQTDP